MHTSCGLVVYVMGAPDRVPVASMVSCSPYVWSATAGKVTVCWPLTRTTNVAKSVPPPQSEPVTVP